MKIRKRKKVKKRYYNDRERERDNLINLQRPAARQKKDRKKITF